MQFENLFQFLRQVICGADTLQLSPADITEMPFHVLPDLPQGRAGCAEIVRIWVLYFTSLGSSV